MAATQLFAPRKLSAIDEFEEWFHETEIWQCLTDLNKKKQGPAIYLSHDENIRKACCDINVKDLSSDNAVNILLRELKSVCQRYQLGCIYSI